MSCSNSYFNKTKYVLKEDKQNIYMRCYYVIHNNQASVFFFSSFDKIVGKKMMKAVRIRTIAMIVTKAQSNQ